MSPSTSSSLAAPGAQVRELRLVLAGLMLSLMLAALDQNIVATALPRITGDLGGLEHLSWVVTSFLVASTVSGPLYGKASDLYGRKPAFVVSISLFLLGSALCGMAASLGMLIGFRALQGLGAGGLFVLSQTVIADLVSPRERGRYQGMFAAVFATCSVAGPLLGGFITEYASWHWIFYVNLPVGAAALTLILVALRPRPPGPAPRLDLLGAALLVASSSSLLLLLSWGGSVYPWSSAPILALIAVTVGTGALLVAAEHRAEQPILPPHLFRNHVFLLGAATIGLAAMALFAATVFLPLMFQLLIGASPSRAGLMIAPMAGGLIVASFLGGRSVSRTGRYKLLPVVGLLIMTLAYAALAWAARTSLGLPVLEFVLVMLGLGIGCVLPTLTTAIQNAVSAGELGAATATSGFFRSLGGALGVAVSGAVLAGYLRALPGTSEAMAGGVTAIASLGPAQRGLVLEAYRGGLSGVFAVCASIAAVGFVTVLFLPELPLRRRGPER